MFLFGDKIKVEISEKDGTPTFIGAVCDSYRMNWIASGIPFGHVDGFEVKSVQTSDTGVSVMLENKDRYLHLLVKRRMQNGVYREEYLFLNSSEQQIELSEDTFGIAFPYNCVFDKKENMHHTRCNSHIWCAGTVCRIQSVKLSGKAPYLLQKTTEDSFLY